MVINVSRALVYTFWNVHCYKDLCFLEIIWVDHTELRNHPSFSSNVFLPKPVCFVSSTFLYKSKCIVCLRMCFGVEDVFVCVCVCVLAFHESLQMHTPVCHSRAMVRLCVMSVCEGGVCGGVSFRRAYTSESHSVKAEIRLHNRQGNSSVVCKVVLTCFPLDWDLHHHV